MRSTSQRALQKLYGVRALLTVRIIEYQQASRLTHEGRAELYLFIAVMSHVAIAIELFEAGPGLDDEIQIECPF